jgi:hypothetical protein
MKRFPKRSLAILLALVMLLALSAVPVFAAAADRPTHSTTVDTPSSIDHITIGGETAFYEQDDNTGTGSEDPIYIRAYLDTEYDLESAEIDIYLVSSGTTVSSTELTFTGGGTTTRTASGVNLLNEKYDVTIGSTTYILAADTPYGTISVSPSDPLKVASVTFTTSPNVTATVEGMSVNGYAGNPWYEEQQQVQDGVNWVEIKYYVRADDQLPLGTTLSAVPGTMSLATGATPSGCVSGSYPSYTFSLSGPLNIMTVSNGGASRDYHVSAGVEGQVLVYYNIVLDEIEGSQYYTGDVIDQCTEIDAAAAEYFDPEGFYVNSGTTVMDILLDFIDWAEDEEYFSDVTETGGGYYLSELDGLAAFDGGDLSGWMYTDEGYSPTCGVPGVGANYYQLTTDGTDIDWFYTIDYTEHPWP